MSSDYNELGASYGLLAFGEFDPSYGALPPNAHTQYKRLREVLAAEASSAIDTNRKRLISGALGCLFRLDAFLLQVARIAIFSARLAKDEILKAEPDALLPPYMKVLRAEDSVFDFESMLFHGRAALDRLTIFIAREHGQTCASYKKLGTILLNFQKKDSRAKSVLDAMASAASIEGTLVLRSGEDPIQSKALRDRSAHGRSILEHQDSCFTVHRLVTGKKIIFDSEFDGVPLLKTAWQLSHDVPFLVLNALCAYVGLQLNSRENFLPAWPNPTASSSDYLDPTEKGPKFTLAKFINKGVVITTVTMRPEIVDTAI